MTANLSSGTVCGVPVTGFGLAEPHATVASNARATKNLI
jgi:hypothetical protein